MTAVICGSFSAGALFGTWWRSVIYRGHEEKARKLREMAARHRREP